MVLMAHSLAVSKDLSAFADQFILSDSAKKVKNYLVKSSENLRKNPGHMSGADGYLLAEKSLSTWGFFTEKSRTNRKAVAPITM